MADVELDNDLQCASWHTLILRYLTKRNEYNNNDRNELRLRAQGNKVDSHKWQMCTFWYQFH